MKDVSARCRALLAVAMVGCATAANGQPPFVPSPAATEHDFIAQITPEQINREPIVVFIADGPPNSCGPGCSRWIAVEGRFDEGSAQRVIKVLDENKELRLPVYFHSTGGFTEQAIELGKHLRRLRMRAGVARTALQRCTGTAISEDCRRLIEKTTDRLAHLRLDEGFCASACVYALIGASFRDITSNARIGVHADTPTRRTDKGLVIVSPAQLTPQERSHRENRLQKLWQHVYQMGVDPALFELAQKIDARSVRFLSHSELIRLGLATKDRFESPWIGRDETPSASYLLFKTLSHPTSATDGGVHLTTTIGLTCYRHDRVNVFIEREMATGETGNEPVIRVVADEKVTWTSTKRMNANYQVDFRTQLMPFDDVVKVVPKHSLELKLEYASPEWASRSGTIKLSIAGLEKELLAMRKRCEKFR
jgi:hypothetical protein